MIYPSLISLFRFIRVRTDYLCWVSHVKLIRLDHAIQYREIGRN